MSDPQAHSSADTALDAVVQADPASLRRSVAAGAIGVFVHWFDWAVYAYLATTLATVFFPAENEVAGVLSVFAVFAVSFGIRPLGALVLGPLGDRIGRQRTLSIVIIVMALATLAIGLLPGYGTIGIAAPILLVVFRLVQGFAAGGEFGSAASFLAEYSPRARRAFGVSWLEFGSLLGFLAGSFAFYLLSVSFTEDQILAWAWRIPFLVAAPMGVIGYIIRIKIEDTPEFRALEATGSVPRSPIKELFRTNARQLLQAAGLMTMMHVLFYAVLTYLVNYQTDQLGHSDDSAALVSTFASLLGLVLVPAFGRLADAIGRKPIMIGAAVALLIVATPAYMLMQTGMVGTIVAALALAAILSAILATHAVWSAEIFPTRTRQGGLSVAYNISAALFAGTVPFFMTILISATGSLIVPGPYLMVAAVVGLVAAVSMRETAGSSLLQEQDLTPGSVERSSVKPTSADGVRS